MRDEEDAFTIEDLNEFLSAKTYAEQFEILLKHSQKNQKAVEPRTGNKNPPNVNKKSYAVDTHFFCHFK